MCITPSSYSSDETDTSADMSSDSAVSQWVNNWMPLHHDCEHPTTNTTDWHHCSTLSDSWYDEAPNKCPFTSTKSSCSVTSVVDVSGTVHELWYIERRDSSSSPMCGRELASPSQQFCISSQHSSVHLTGRSGLIPVHTSQSTDVSNTPDRSLRPQTCTHLSVYSCIKRCQVSRVHVVCLCQCDKQLQHHNNAYFSVHSIVISGATTFWKRTRRSWPLPCPPFVSSILLFPSAFHPFPITFSSVSAVFCTLPA